MDVGIIAPTKMLSDYCTTKIHYCIPSLLVLVPEYRRFYEEKSKDKENILILDCRKLGWKKLPEEVDVCKKAIELIKPEYIVGPSVMFDYTKTLKVLSKFTNMVDPLDAIVAGCIEGTTPQEVEACSSGIEDLLGLGIKAIPSHMYNTAFKSPLDWKRSYLFIDSHLTIEEVYGKEGLLVTSLPVRLGFQGKILSNYYPTPPSLNFSEDKDKYPMVTKSNIKEAIKLLS